MTYQYLDIKAMPMVSVIMPSMNQNAFIADSVKSVLSQNYSNLELIIIDGGSTDGTIECLARQQALDSRLRFFSEPDTGPANALNKALLKTRGTIIGWLNSDDLYTPEAIKYAVKTIIDGAFMMVYGEGQHIDANSNVLNDYPSLPPSAPVSKFMDGCFICQPTVFFKRTFPLLLGNLDENLKTAFDFDYWMRAFLAFHHRIGFVDRVQAYSRLHEDCITMKMRQQVIIEGMQVLERHLGYAPKEWVLTYINEIVTTSSHKEKVNLKPHIYDMLITVKPLIKLNDFKELESIVDELLT